MYEHLVWLVPLAVAVLGAWRPRAGLLLLAGSLPLFGSPPGGPYLGALEVAGLAAIVTAWRAGRPRPSPLGWPVAAFVAVSLASLVPVTYLPPAWRPGVLVELLRALPGVAAWQALYTWRAALDLLLGWGLFLAFRRAYAGRSPRPLALALLAGLVTTLLLGLATQSDLVDLDGFRPQLPRLESLYFLAGWLSQYIVLAWPLAMAALATGGRRTRLLTVPLMALVMACLALTLQRGAWVAMAAQLLFWIATSAGRWRRQSANLKRLAMAAAAAGVMAAGLLVVATDSVEPIVQRAGSIRSGVVPRVALWGAAARMTAERPLLGWGLGSFAPAYDMWYPDGAPDTPRTHDAAHSLYFQVAAERGLMGLAALGLAAWAAALCLRRAQARRRPLALALSLSLVGAAVYGLVQYIFYLRSNAWLLWLLMGAVAVVGGEEVTAPGRRLARALAVAALVLVPLRAVFVEPPAYPGNRGFGLHKMEENPAGPFRWTEGFAARRVRREGDALVLRFANGHPLPVRRPVAVTVGVDGTEMAEITVEGGWEEHRFDLAPSEDEWILLTVAARPTFRPFSDYRRYAELDRSKDIRSLGVALMEPRWQAATATD